MNNKLNTKVLKKSYTTFGYGMNTYTNCAHGCKYCYSFGEWFKHNPKADYDRYYNDWINPKIRKLDLKSQVQKDIQIIRDAGEEIPDIFVCSASDAYQPLEQEYGLTRQVLEVLIQNELPFTVLTKSNLVLRDLDLFKSYDKCRVGLTVITLDEDFRKVLEPHASPIEERIEALKKLKDAGVSTYCSVEPIMPCKQSDPFAIVDRLKDYVDLFEFGKWNPKQGLSVPVEYDEGYYVDLFEELFKYCEDEDITHCVASHSEEFLKKNKIKYIPPLLVTDRPYPKSYFIE